MTKTKTIHKRIISLLAAMMLCFVFCMPVFAAEHGTGTQAFTSERLTFEDSVQPRYPGYAGIISMTAYPANFEQSIYYDGFPTTVYSPSGRDQLLNLTLDSQASEVYRSEGCNAFVIQASVNLTGATRYELYENGTLVETGSCSSGTANLNLLIRNNSPATWKMVVYDNITPTQGKPLIGNVYLS